MICCKVLSDHGKTSLELLQGRKILRVQGGNEIRKNLGVEIRGESIARSVCTIVYGEQIIVNGFMQTAQCVRQLCKGVLIRNLRPAPDLFLQVKGKDGRFLCANVAQDPAQAMQPVGRFTQRDVSKTLTNCRKYCGDIFRQWSQRRPLPRQRGGDDGNPQQDDLSFPPQVRQENHDRYITEIYINNRFPRMKLCYSQILPEQKKPGPCGPGFFCSFDELSFS